MIYCLFKINSSYTVVGLSHVVSCCERGEAQRHICSVLKSFRGCLIASLGINSLPSAIPPPSVFS